MQRREFIGLIGGAAAWPLAARAQQPAGRVYRVDTSRSGPGATLYATKAFEEGLRSLGYRIGENVVIEYRFAKPRSNVCPPCGRLGADRRDIIIAAGAIRPRMRP